MSQPDSTHPEHEFKHTNGRTSPHQHHHGIDWKTKISSKLHLKS
uniref:Uncharacterized protein n=1 Tax=Mesocestoides corti TaxID=53468 RepID=A0A5K3FZV4_MESCO